MEQTAFDLMKAIDDLRNGIHSKIDLSTSEAKERENKINDQIDALQKRLDAIQARAERPDVTGGESDYTKAFKTFMRRGDDTGVVKAMAAGTDADGGFSIPEEWDKALINVARDQNVMRQLCTVFSVGTEDYKKLVNIHGATFGWVGETSARTNTNTAQFAALTPVFGEAYAHALATQKVLDDSILDLGAWLVGEIGDEIAVGEEAAFTVGNGVNRPKGFLAYNVVSTADATRAFGDIQYVASGASGAFTTANGADALIDLTVELKAAYRSGAAFMAPKSVFRAVRKFKDANNQYIWQQSIQAGQPSVLLGYPLHENEQMAAMAANSISLAFGNWKRAYYIADRIGTRLLRDPYTNKPYIVFYVTKRVGGFLADSNAVKVMKFYTS